LYYNAISTSITGAVCAKQRQGGSPKGYDGATAKPL
jgi:hypothetical protein